MDVTLSSDSFSPGDMATLTIRTTDGDGNPKAANVNIAVVDEALFALRDYTVDTLSLLYRGINSGVSLLTTTHENFRSEGFLTSGQMQWSAVDAVAAAPVAEAAVDMGGGAQDTHIRETFEDTAYFHSLRTNQNGFATLSFRLPDNITSWRLSASGLTNDFYAGNSVQNIRVTIPMFLHYSLGSTFLVGDIPYLGMNVYGTGLNGDEIITFEVWIDVCECCPHDVTRALVLTATGAPFERVNIPLWEMSGVGLHSINIRATSDTGKSDGIRHFFYVLESHQAVDTAVFYGVT